jgi:long-chain fatty acid transport protein
MVNVGAYSCGFFRGELPLRLSKSSSRRTSRIACSSLIPVAACLSQIDPASAAGYGVHEWSAVAMGAAYAGSSATNSDASFLAYNPASLGGVGRYDSSVSLTGLFPNSSATYTTATTGALTPAGGLMTPDDFVKIAGVPNLAARMRLSPQWALGIAIYAPWGLSTLYPEGWAGRYHALNTNLLTVDITPTVSYQISNNFTLAAGVQVQYAKGKLSNAVDIGTIGALFAIPGSVPGGQDGKAVFKADGWGAGFVLGAMGQIADGVSLGLSYRSAVSATVSGPLDFTLDTAGVGAAIKGATTIFTNANAKAQLTTPDTINAGARVQLTPAWTALIEADWINWSRFHELRVVSDNPAQPDDVTVADWEDSWFVSVGAEFQPNEMWTFRGGVGFDQTPVPNATRNPRIPDESRTSIGVGFTYHPSRSLDLTLSYMHLFLPRASINLNVAQPGNAIRGNLVGTSNIGADFVGVQLNYRTS